MSEHIGARVVVPGQARGYGILKYIGPIEGKHGTFGGVELQGPVATLRGKNSGAVDGIQYFEVSQPMTGLFLPWERLRSVNPKLQLLNDNRVLLSNSDIHTPSPTTRSGLRVSSVGRADSISRVSSNGRESPYWKRQNISVQKRDKHGPDDELRHELTAAKQALEISTKQLQEKKQILEELQHTVSELNPILEDYEHRLAEKDRKIKKQKQEYDRAREEWRQSLDLMLNGQQQAEDLYEHQIEDLKEELAKLAKASSKTHSGQDQLLMDKLVAENARLKSLSEDELIEQLHTKIDRLTQDVASLEIVLQEAHKQNREKDAQIAQLEIQLDELKDSNVTELRQGVDSLSIEGKELKEHAMQLDEQKTQHKKEIDILEKQIIDLEDYYSKQITNLEHRHKQQIADLEVLHQQQITDLEDHQTSSSKENVPQKSDLLNKIAVLEDDLTTNKYLVGTQSKKIEELEKEIEDSVVREEILRNKSKQIDALNVHAANLRTIEDLEHELSMRPTYDELSELQTSLDEVDRLHRNELFFKEEELISLKESNKKLEAEKNNLLNKIESLSAATMTPLSNKSVNIPDTYRSFDSDSWDKTDSLPIFTPHSPADPSSGRNNWCGLCERDGHSSLNCPYENDIF